MAPDLSSPPHYPHPRDSGRALQEHRPSRFSVPTPALAALAALAASAAYVQLRARNAERRNPPVGRFVDVDDVRLHYTSHGQGEPVVLLHGNGALVHDFALSGLIDLLARKYEVIVFDRPGYGYSDRPRHLSWTPRQQATLFRRAFRVLGIEKPVVLGHSWGALIALALDLDHAGSISGLVLLSGYFYPTVRADVVMMSPPAIPVVGDVMRYTVAPLYSRLIWPALIRKLFYPNPVPAHFEQFPRWMVLRPGQLRAAAQESALMIRAAGRLSPRYGDISVPVVIMAGADDAQVTTAHHSERLQGDLPNSTLHIVPGVGHMVHHIVPEAVASAVDQAFHLAAAANGVTSGPGQPAFAGAEHAAEPPVTQPASAQ